MPNFRMLGSQKVRKTRMVARFTQTFSLLAALGAIGCGSDDSGSNGGSGGGGSDSSCFASSMQLTETKLTDAPSFNTVLLDFDAKNTSSKDYDIQAGSKAIMLDFVVTTTDGTEYETTAPFTAARIDAGAIAPIVAMAEYGAGKTYESYTVELRCR